MQKFIREAASSFSLNEGSREFMRIYQPFLDKWHIENFYYARLTKTGKLVYLTNRVDYILDYWGLGCPYIQDLLKPPMKCKASPVYGKEV